MYTKTKKFKESKFATCKYCKTNKVHWADTEYGWLLFNKKSGIQHKCKEKYEKN